MRLVAIPEQSSGGPPSPPGPECTLLSTCGESMGTTWQARFYASGPQVAADADRALLRCLDGVVGQMSHYLPESDLCRFNAARAGKWVELPEPLFSVLTAGLRVAKESGGAFDPTAGLLVDSWGFGPAGSRGRPPGETERSMALAGTGWSRILIDEARKRAWQPGGVELNLSSIAKGFAVDEAARAFDSIGIRSYLIEIGGELRARGVKADGQPWWVAVETPPETESFPEVVIALCGESIATSGSYRRAFIHNGREYSHCIDPRTGEAVSNGIISVTVVHRECMLADAYSTAIQVMGAEAGLALADKRGMAALVVSEDHGRFTHACSRAFLAMLDE